MKNYEFTENDWTRRDGKTLQIRIYNLRLIFCTCARSTERLPGWKDSQWHLCPVGGSFHVLGRSWREGWELIPVPWQILGLECRLANLLSNGPNHKLSHASWLGDIYLLSTYKLALIIKVEKRWINHHYIFGQCLMLGFKTFNVYMYFVSFFFLFFYSE